MVKTIYTDGEYQLELESKSINGEAKISFTISNTEAPMQEWISVNLCPIEDLDELIEELTKKKEAAEFLIDLEANQFEQEMDNYFENKQSKTNKYGRSKNKKIGR